MTYNLIVSSKKGLDNTTHQLSDHKLQSDLDFRYLFQHHTDVLTSIRTVLQRKTLHEKRWKEV
jgi:hypothetical protein